jgi:hypothetical protein
MSRFRILPGCRQPTAVKDSPGWRAPTLSLRPPTEARSVGATPAERRIHAAKILVYHVTGRGHSQFLLGASMASRALRGEVEDDVRPDVVLGHFPRPLSLTSLPARLRGRW